MDCSFIELIIKKLQWLLDHPEVTWSGSGIYALSLIGSAVLVVVSCVFRRKKKSVPVPEDDSQQQPPAQEITNQFNNNGGDQNIAQGKNPIGKQVNNYFRHPLKQRILFFAALLISGVMSTALVVYDQLLRKPLKSVTKISTSAPQSPAIIGDNATVNYGVPQEQYDQIKKVLDVGDAALASFFKILEQGKVPREDWGVRLPEIAFRYKELLQRFESVTSDDPEVQTLKKEAGQAIKEGDYDRVDELLDQIDERHDKAIQQLHKLRAETAVRLEKEQLAKAENLVSRAKLQRLQYHYAKSAQYFQEAAALPEGHKAKRAVYLGAAGQDLYRIARYTEALSLYEQSLSISREISDRNGEAKSLNNISTIYHAQGKYSKALHYLEQSLPICREIDNKEGEGATLNNISQIYHAKGDYPQALHYLEQSLPLLREVDDKESEGTTLNNIGMIHYAQREYAVALEYYNQALAVAREIKDKATAGTCLNNISLVYQAQENYDAALEYVEQDLAITRQIGDRRGEGTTLNNIGTIYDDKGNYAAALKQYEQALAIADEISDKTGEATSSWNIGGLYVKQGELIKAEQYMSRAVELAEHLEHPDLEDWRKLLEAVRTKLQEQRNE